MKQYLNMLSHIMANGTLRDNRTGTPTRGVFGYQMRFDLSNGFPLVTTKLCHFKSIVYELLWFLAGDSNINYLKQHSVSIWNEWADDDGNLGPVYGKLWRSWRGSGGEVDQIKQLITNLKSNPYSRRHIISAWEPSVLPDESISPQQNVAQNLQALAPCHCLFQFYISSDGKLSCHLYQRSADAFLGVPFNIASYSLLTYLVAQVVDLQAGDFVHTFGDLHIYQNHLEQVKLQLKREPLTPPTLNLNSEISNIFDFTYQDIILKNYQNHPAIKGKVSI